ncbi:MAG: nickel pincer cofactor biosynthesis protein LarC [Candidatus Brocadiia bacterium]|jgi:hypothetical protein|nr:nickel pincer cofactor biosynthesis protein LarC [Candidatus Brocadiia bacterium]
MKIGYLDCFSGVSGDMMLGALVDAGVALETIRAALAGLPLEGYRLEEHKVTRGGIAATKVDVILAHEHEHAHRGLSEVTDLIRAGELSTEVEGRSIRVFRNLAEAEAKVHGTTVEHVHFHEVGAVDAICDIVGAVAGFEALGLDELLFSKVALGGGMVRTEHGSLPVPAPATAELLKGLPTAGGPVEFELTTPTGAALLRTLGRPSPGWPEMAVERIGCGAGGRDISGHPNVLRLAVGTPERGAESDEVWVLEVNLDDMTGEEIGYLAERLRNGGALEVFTTPVQMKKNRPGVLLTVLCTPEGRGAMEEVLWRHSTTLGVRRSLRARSKLARRHETVETPWGEVRVKLGLLGDEVVRCEPEYEDCRRIAEAAGVALREVNHAARTAWHAGRQT